MKDLTPRVNMIVALDTDANLYTSLTQSNTDSDVMATYLSKLVMMLTKENKNWRQDSILLLDGASYHRSQETRLMLKKLNVKYIISAPYSYDAAPVELFFAYLKREMLNPENEKTGKG